MPPDDFFPKLKKFCENRKILLVADEVLTSMGRTGKCLCMEPFDEAGKRIYQRAFSKGLAWIPAGHILRMSPPIIMPEQVAHMGMDIIEESIGEVERELGYVD